MHRPVSAVGRRRVEVDEERRIHLPCHTAALFGFDSGEQVAVGVVDLVAQQVADLSRGDRRDRGDRLRLRCVGDPRAGDERQARR
ncbi:hypothetical protein ABQF17_00840 [Mycolicibacterium elephantis]